MKLLFKGFIFAVLLGIISTLHYMFNMAIFADTGFGVIKTTKLHLVNRQNVIPRPLEDTTKYIILVTYMRGGSSFLGDLFETHPETMYWFEPLQALYRSLTGSFSSHPFTIDYDKMHHLRYKLEWERKGIRNHLKKMFFCKFDSLPIEFFPLLNIGVHPTNLTTVYKNCIGKNWHKLAEYISHCRITAFGSSCRGTVSDNIKNNCHNDMKASRDLALHNTENLTSEQKSSGVKLYASCLNTMLRKVKICTPRIQNMCSNSRLRVIKAIRLDFDIVGDLIANTNSNVYVIHLLRDPRGIILSRKKAGLLSFPMWEEAEKLCQKMRKDIIDRRALEQKYPGVFREFLYEDLADKSLEISREMYAHFGESMPFEVKHWLKKATSTRSPLKKTYSSMRSNSSAVAHAWRKNISKADKFMIDKVCKDLYKVTPYQI